jgi:hypothetical protein
MAAPSFRYGVVERPALPGRSSSTTRLQRTRFEMLIRRDGVQCRVLCANRGVCAHRRSCYARPKLLLSFSTRTVGVEISMFSAWVLQLNPLSS